MSKKADEIKKGNFIKGNFEIGKNIKQNYEEGNNFWSFTGIIRGFEEFKPITIKDIKEKGMKSKILDKISIKQSSKDRYEVIYDRGKIVLTVEYAYIPKKEAHIFSNKFNVADTDYEETLNVLYELLKLIKLSFPKFTEEKYTLTIYYKENPYYEFYLKQIPKPWVKDFPLKLSFPKESSLINISKSKIQVSSKDFEYLRQDIKKVLELSDISV